MVFTAGVHVSDFLYHFLSGFPYKNYRVCLWISVDICSVWNECVDDVLMDNRILVYAKKGRISLYPAGPHLLSQELKSNFYFWWQPMIFMMFTINTQIRLKSYFLSGLSYFCYLLSTYYVLTENHYLKTYIISLRLLTN